MNWLDSKHLHTFSRLPRKNIFISKARLIWAEDENLIEFFLRCINFIKIAIHFSLDPFQNLLENKVAVDRFEVADTVGGFVVERVVLVALLKEACAFLRGEESQQTLHQVCLDVGRAAGQGRV